MAYLQGVQEVQGAERIRTAVCGFTDSYTRTNRSKPRRATLSEPDVQLVSAWRGLREDRPAPTDAVDLNPSGSDSVKPGQSSGTPAQSAAVEKGHALPVSPALSEPGGSRKGAKTPDRPLRPASPGSESDPNRRGSGSRAGPQHLRSLGSLLPSGWAA